MTSADLKPAQADRLRADLGRQLRYLNKLCARMQVQRWPLDDAVCRETLRARDAMQALVTAAQGAGRDGAQRIQAGEEFPDRIEYDWNEPR